MKTILVAAAALGLSAIGAAAECPGHTQQVLASTVDDETKTASVESNQTQTSTQTPVIVVDDQKAKPE